MLKKNPKPFRSLRGYRGDLHRTCKTTAKMQTVHVAEIPPEAHLAPHVPHCMWTAARSFSHSKLGLTHPLLCISYQLIRAPFSYYSSLIFAFTILTIIWEKQEWNSSTHTHKKSKPQTPNAKPICLFLQSRLLVPETGRPQCAKTLELRYL